MRGWPGRLALALLIAAGLGPGREALSAFWGILAAAFSGNAARPLTLAIAVRLVLPPILPLLLFWTPDGKRPRPWLAAFAMLGALGGAALILFVALFAGQGRALLLLTGFAGLAAGLGAVLRPLGLLKTARLLMAFAGIVALWSLAAGLSAGVGAARIAADAPYCIARHGEGPVPSHAALRGARLFTAQGWDGGDRSLQFHGLLLTESASYNWSPARLRWMPIENPDGFLLPIRPSCTPTPGFLSTLRLF